MSYPNAYRLPQTPVKQANVLAKYVPFMGLGAVSGLMVSQGLSTLRGEDEKKKFASGMLGLAIGALLGTAIARAFDAYNIIS